MFMYLIETEINVRAGSAKAGTHQVRQIVVADDAEQAKCGLLDTDRLAGLLSVSIDEIEAARITACDQHLLPKTPAVLLAIDTLACPRAAAHWR